MDNILSEDNTGSMDGLILWPAVCGHNNSVWWVSTTMTSITSCQITNFIIKKVIKHWHKVGKVGHKIYC